MAKRPRISAQGASKIGLGLPAKANGVGKPASGSYPMPDKAQPRRPSRMRRGYASWPEEQIDAKANKVLGKGRRAVARLRPGTRSTASVPRPTMVELDFSPDKPVEEMTGTAG